MDKLDKSQIKYESVKTSTVTKNGVRTTITERTVTMHDGKVYNFKEEKSENAGSAPSNGKPTLMMSSGGQPSSGPSGGSSGPAPSTDLKTFRDQALKSHNTLRAKHGSPPLKYSSDLNDYAQKWAEHLAKSGRFQHSDCTLNGTRLGENIANKWSSQGADYTGEEPVEQWYSEISKYPYKGDNGAPGTGHFTQVVWKGSTELGMGKAQTKDGKVIAVGSYRPAGNMMGTYSQNVFPPK